MSDAAILKATAATLRTAAGWGQHCEPSTLVDIAKAIEHGNIEMSCPVCEETRCDESCPLAPVRAKYVQP